MPPVPEPVGYKDIADDLRDQIRSGVLSPGTRMLSLVDLAYRYGVARGTADRAMQILKREGLVVGERGKRPVVAQPPQMQAVTPERGSRVGPGRPATPAECREMGLPEGAWITPKTYGGRTKWYPVATTEFTVK